MKPKEMWNEMQMNMRLHVLAELHYSDSFAKRSWFELPPQLRGELNRRLNTKGLAAQYLDMNPIDQAFVSELAKDKDTANFLRRHM